MLSWFGEIVCVNYAEKMETGKLAIIIGPDSRIEKHCL